MSKPLPDTAYSQLVETPVGSLFLGANNAALTHLAWAKELPLGFVENPNTVTEQAAQQLKEYFSNERQSFDIKLELEEGTDFQKSVWQEIATIPLGKTVTYKNIADKLDSAPRAVGGAVGANPIPIIVPCHRVVGEKGMITGFSGGDGIPTKIKLLEHEGVR
ncbi:MAG: methylated-DNA--[protein]-cysteine S-methyltransferase [Alphaproteobacteria bacterium]|nr:methylated-DNA--[protein]-cysteine S-methyltransferase [Alphaproteobacteria bacterium]MDD9919184.1 methylated-DNA--[protein]-cysteine S-methyltransferase [Alphaproteobacteria bacterium]